MKFNVSPDRLRFWLNRLRERLWVKPLVVCLVSIAAVFLAELADGTVIADYVPTIEKESVEELLSIMAASMLVIATFSVASMVSAYASASSTATPRSFSVVVADDASQNALSTFVGAFIFSIVAITAMKNGYFGAAGLFILFVITGFVFSVVIFTFVRWVDRIARLGRMGSTIDKVEQATATAMRRRRLAPSLCGVSCAPVNDSNAKGTAIFSDQPGYVQYVDVAELNDWAQEKDVRIVVAALPGTFAVPGRAIAYVRSEEGKAVPAELDAVVKAFTIASGRRFDDDPRFGLVVLSEIAGRALSPGINDPGTAINILESMVRLFVQWSAPLTGQDKEKSESLPQYDRVEVPHISERDMFDDAFTVIARDGAGLVEVAVRLQKSLAALSTLDNPELQAAARRHGRLALARAEQAMTLAEDLEVVRQVSGYIETRSI